MEKNSEKSPNKSWEWYDPPENSAPVTFFLNTGLHGLLYLGQKKRHFCERIFWFIAFTASVVTAAVLIWKMWQGYIATPIITVSSSNEKRIDEFSFPGITICNLNNVKKSIWEEYKRNAEIALQGDLSNETVMERFASVHDIYHICQSSKTFAETFWNTQFKPPDQQKLRAALNKNFCEYSHLLDPSKTLYKVSQSCDDMIIFCRWLGKATNCSSLFRETQTDFGLCCTFNTIPDSLLKRGVNDSNEDAEILKEWEKADLNNENLIREGKRDKRKFPYRQRYAGRYAGLSFLVDPQLEEYHCTNTDSEGFVVGVNLPLDVPRMMDNGVAVRTRSEVFIGVRPEITISKDSAKQFKLEKRHCYLDGEKQLTHYTKYTSSNCIDECIANETLKECGCLRYYMPRHSNERFCSRKKYKCTEKIREKIVYGGIYKRCKTCWPSCSEILYHTEVTSLDIRDKYIDTLFDMHPHLRKSKDLSIVHVYFNVDSVYPRLRKEMSTVINLISNAGGLLGLCLGFSVLSVLEIVYHATIRVIFENYRKRSGIDGKEGGNTTGHNNVNVDKPEMLQASALLEKRDVGFLSKVLNRHHQITAVENFGDHHQSFHHYHPSSGFSSNYSIKVNE